MMTELHCSRKRPNILKSQWWKHFISESERCYRLLAVQRKSQENCKYHRNCHRIVWISEISNNEIKSINKSYVRKWLEWSWSYSFCSPSICVSLNTLWKNVLFFSKDYPKVSCFFLFVFYIVFICALSPSKCCCDKIIQDFHQVWMNTRVWVKKKRNYAHLDTPSSYQSFIH